MSEPITDICTCGHIRLWHDDVCSERFCPCVVFTAVKQFAICSDIKRRIGLVDPIAPEKELRVLKIIKRKLGYRPLHGDGTGTLS